MDNVFQSSRLAYRAMEDNDEDKKFYHEELDCPPEFLYLSDNRLLKPKSAKVSHEDYNMIANTGLLSVMICLLPGSGNSGKEVDGNRDEESKKPIPIGFLNLSSKGKDLAQHRDSILGIAIAKAYQGKGYGPEAIKWALDWAFVHAGLHCVRLGCFSFNTNAKKVYERIGFVLEGRKREGLWVNGGWHDGLMYSILDREWKEIKGRV
jgi:ribosomal protein S18 acetylase RimI-like enzyme